MKFHIEMAYYMYKAVVIFILIQMIKCFKINEIKIVFKQKETISYRLLL